MRGLGGPLTPVYLRDRYSFNGVVENIQRGVQEFLEWSKYCWVGAILQLSKVQSVSIIVNDIDARRNRGFHSITLFAYQKLSPVISIEILI